MPLGHIPTGSYDQIPFFLRLKSQAVTGGEESFRLFRGEGTPFTEEHRKRLVGHGVKFVYIRMADHGRFRHQMESRINEIVSDPAIAMSQKSAIVYETSLELMNELLSEPDLAATSPRLEQMSRAVTTLAINDGTAFSHLFAASHHDFYTATHMVNVGTWMVPLALALGHADSEELHSICLAGFLHDIGKVHVSEDILNKPDPLSDEDWAVIRRHPELGDEHLRRYENTNELVLTVARQHHERLDGSGYPDGLSAEQIHPVSKICALVDSFDAMTALRPFKARAFSVAEALSILKRETPEKYDPAVMEAWIGLLGSTGAAAAGAPGAETPDFDGAERRKHARLSFSAPGRVHLLEEDARGWYERPGFHIIAHSISCSGLGFLSMKPIQPGESAHVYLQGEHYDRKCLTGEIVRARRHGGGWYEVGMHFHEEQADLNWIDELASCAAPQKAAS